MTLDDEIETITSRYEDDVNVDEVTRDKNIVHVWSKNKECPPPLFSVPDNLHVDDVDVGKHQEYDPCIYGSVTDDDGHDHEVRIVIHRYGFDDVDDPRNREKVYKPTVRSTP